MLVVPGRKPDDRRAATGCGQSPWVLLALRQIVQVAGNGLGLGGPAQAHQRLDQVGRDRKGSGVSHALATGVLPWQLSVAPGDWRWSAGQGPPDLEVKYH